MNRLEFKKIIIKMLSIAEEVIEGSVLLRDNESSNFWDSKENKIKYWNGMWRGSNQIMTDYSEYDWFVITNDGSDIACCGKWDAQGLDELEDFIEASKAGYEVF